MLSFLSLPLVVSASGPNYWSNKEYAQLIYRGYIQFQPSYYDRDLGVMYTMHIFVINLIQETLGDDMLDQARVEPIVQFIKSH